MGAHSVGFGGDGFESRRVHESECCCESDKCFDVNKGS